MKRAWLPLLALSMAVAAPAALVHAQTLPTARHAGATDPLSEGFVFGNVPPPPAGITLGAVNSGTPAEDAWAVVDSGNDKFQYSFHPAPGTEAAWNTAWQAGYTLRARVLTPDAGDAVDGGVLVQVGSGVGGGRRHIISFGVAAGRQTANLHGSTLGCDGNAAYRTYELVFDGTTASLSTPGEIGCDAAITGVAPANLVFPPLVDFGSGTGGGTGTGHYALVELTFTDVDADGLDHYTELVAGTDPNDADSDGDGLSDGSEVITHATDPIDPDSDGDGLLDGFEVANGFDPLLPGEQSGDPDGDGLTNLAEQQIGSDPNLADTDGDGLDDLVERGHARTVASWSIVTPNAIPNKGVAIDVDGDGDLDLATQESQRIDLHPNLGAGTFGPPTPVLDQAVLDLFPMDADGDGDDDVFALVTLSSGVGTTRVLLLTNAGTGALDPPIVIVSGSTTTGAGPIDLEPGDLDGDGDLDLLVLWSDGGLRWYRNEPGPSFSLAGTLATIQITALNASDEIRVLGTADLDDDGELDVLARNLTSANLDGSLLWFENLGTGSFAAGLELFPGAIGDAFAPADLDGDGDLDLVLDDSTAGVVWHENLGGASFGAAQPIESTRAPNLLAVDVDGDLDLDLIRNDATSPDLSWLENAAGDGSTWLNHPISTSGGARRMRTGDYDADGAPDVLFLNFVFENPATRATSADSDAGGLGDAYEVATGLDPRRPDDDTGDPDGDGLPSDVEQALGTDPLDPDSDDDGLLDGVETNTGIFVDPGDTGTDPLAFDSDGGVLGDGYEVGVGLDPHDPSDDTGDPDGDGLPSHVEQGLGTDPTDPDTDADAYLDGVETATGTFVSTADTGTDPLNPDSDGDGYPDGVETGTGVFVSIADPGTDPTRYDTDADGLGDALELATGIFVSPLDPGTDPNATDTDAGGAADGFEVDFGFDPHDPVDDGIDTDGDGLTNAAEWLRGSRPLDPDSDGDGLSDAVETGTGVYVGPNDTGTRANDPDGDGDLLHDGFELAHGFDPHAASPTFADPDGDGLTNLAEQGVGSDPNLADTDADGLDDGAELAPATAQSWPVETVLAGEGSSFLGIRVADFDRSGRADALLQRWDTFPNDTTLRWLEPSGEAWLVSSVGTLSGAALDDALAIPDLDGDGRSDVVTSLTDGNTFAIGFGTALNRLATPAAAFVFGSQSVFGNDLAEIFESIMYADLDGDGLDDVLFAERGLFETGFRTALNLGNGLMGPSQEMATASFVNALAGGDLDGDGDVDVVGAASGGLIAFENVDGRGGLGPEQVIDASALQTAVELADLDFDGDLDIVATSSAGNDRLRWFANDGTGGFSLADALPASTSGLDALRLADLDGDGDLDFLYVDALGGIGWAENLGSGVLGTERTLSSDYPLSFDVGVLRPGLPDVLFASAFAPYPIRMIRNPASDPTDPDSDDDGLLDGDEANLHATDPTKADSDDDGANDAAEVAAGTDPLDAFHFPVATDAAAVAEPGNPTDPATGFGAVAQAYTIGRFEVTVREYVSFLNAVADADPNGLFHPTTDPAYGITRSGADGSYHYQSAFGFADRPVAYVNLWNAMRYVNWLHNGQPVGAQGSATTEDGAYTITPAGIAANDIVRNPSAAFTLPIEDEWYKAAYSDPANPGTYHAHPTGSPIATSCTAPNALPDSANCDGAVGATTDVGSYPGSASANAAFDLGGNVWEWTESIAGVNRRIRGGSFTSPAATLTATSSGFDEDPLAADAELGFRVVPEPGPIGGLVAGWTALAAAAATRRRPPLDTNRTS